MIPIKEPKTQTILIVDDEPANLRVLSEFLLDSGYDVLIAQDGASALYRAEKMQPDLILLDIKMPKMDGFETCRHLKENPLTQDIPVIFITAFTDVENKIKGFDLGGVDYITKPIQNREVVARVQTHLMLRQLQKELQQRNKTLIDSLQSFSKLVRPETAYEELLRLLTTQFQVDRCQIVLQNADETKMEVKAVSPVLNETDISYPILQQALKTRQTQFVSDVYTSRSAENPTHAVLSVIVVPLHNQRGEAIGALYLDRRDHTKPAFTPQDVQHVQKIAEILSPILAHQEDVEITRVDSEIRKLGLFIGNSRKMRQVYQEIEKAAKVDSTVYIHGESGTGKELVAKALHQLSSRRDKPYIAVNCAAIPRELAESEFFGYDKGAFSGAVTTKPGKFELADGGTLFLDEIADLSMELQAKLLRAIQEKEIWRVGGQKALPVDVRIIIATSKNLEEEVQKGTFRSDLYYRFNVLRIALPPLDKRKEDIPLLAFHFLQKQNTQISGFTPEAIYALQNHTWKGNVRELENLIEKAVVYHEGNQPLTPKDLFPEEHVTTAPLVSTPEKVMMPEGKTLDEKLKFMECQIVTQTLHRLNGHKRNTAAELGITRSRLDRIIKRYHIPLTKKT